ncbi:MAG: hypothetical protein IPN34_01330 [Planctomycetes bacterium]|nr:hypothetical protein [Planctomycetota bacterium]
MSLFGLSSTALLLGALALLATLFVLHLLRVRLRRVEVDTLLFFERLGSVKQPRALPGSPARWLAFALAAAALLATWLAFADPRSGLDEPSRFLVVEPAEGALLAQRLDEAERWVRERGLGPRGAVIAAAATPTPWLRSDEPLELLRARAARAAHPSDAAAKARALAQIAARASERDEVVWIGGRAPALGAPLALREAWIEERLLLEWHGARWSHTLLAESDTPQRVLELEGRSSEPLALVLLDASGASLARAELGVGAFSVALAASSPSAEGAPRCALQVLRADAEIHRWVLPTPSARARRVALAGDLAEPLARALRALIALDPRFELQAEVASAELIVAAADEAADPRPRLVLSPGVGDGERRAELARSAPFALALRDRTRRDAPALAAGAGTAWVEDLRRGAVLARAAVDASGPRVEIVDWLLDPPTHADTPRLLAGALEFLAGFEELLLAPARSSFELACATDAAVRSSSAQAIASAGRVRFPSAREAAGALALPHGTAELAVLEDLGAPSAAEQPPLDAVRAESAAHGGSGRWIAPLLLLALLLLLVDAYAFHRGRLP